MRKLFAIIMLVAYLFNLAGYNAFFQYSIHRANSRVVEQLDNNQYSDDQLVEVKIKLNLPYMSDWGSYERFDGDIEFEGVHYNYVKRKISQDTLYVLCLPNHNKTELYKAKSNYIVSVNDIDSGKETNNTSVKKSLSIDEYRQQAVLYDFACVDITRSAYNDSPSLHIPRLYKDVPGKPPEINS